MRSVTTALEPLRRCDDHQAVAWSDPADHHVTLHYLGSGETDPVGRALAAALDDFERDHPPPEVVLGPGLLELGSAIALPAAGLDRLAGRVRRAVAHLGQPPAFPDFLGHLTVGRWRSGRPRPRLIEVPEVARFPVESVELMVTGQPRGPAGPAYETVGRWALGAGRSG